MKVLKFGGSSVGTPQRIKHVIEIIRKYKPGSIAVVFSAFGGATDQLIGISKQAQQGDAKYLEALTQFIDRHLTAVRALIPVNRQSQVMTSVKILLNELEDVLHGISLLRELTPRSLDYVMSFGERLSAQIITEALEASGIPSQYTDARKLICTDNQYGAARVNFLISNQRIQKYFENNNRLQVITGFIASSESGETTTLGRSGSDYTAAIVAAALHAEVLEIWTDVDGIMTADPRLVKKSFTIPVLSYEEAMELSHFGAKVIFPATMRPVMELNIPIRIKNTFNPDGPDTLIHAGMVNGKLVKGISVIQDISLLNLQGSGMVGVAGVSSRLFGALARENINVILISQASSEHSICFAVEPSCARLARKIIECEFRYEIRDKLIDGVYLNENLSVIAVVGDGMKHQPGTSGRMFSALGKNGVNVVAIAQGSSERNISAVISQKDTPKAMAALHDAFFLSNNKTLHLYLAGTGLIGSTLLRQMAAQEKRLAEVNNLEIRLAGIANSRKMILTSEGISLKDALEHLQAEGNPMNLEEYKSQILHYNLPNSVFVDCTASEEVAALYHYLLKASVSVVTPNKKANSGKYADYCNLMKARSVYGAHYLYETNVSAGLPVISTLNDLLVSGDEVVRIEAVLSGTLNYIFSNFTKGKRFSEIVADARNKGYTEPDPREDLSGMDVARKMLILARESGFQIELQDIEVQSLVPDDSLLRISTNDFMKRLPQYDGYFETMRHEAESNNCKLVYLATMEQGKITVGLRGVKSEHPFYDLSGSDNMLKFETTRYSERPMIIRGPGAGAEVTAAGVFADIIRIGNHIR